MRYKAYNSAAKVQVTLVFIPLALPISQKPGTTVTTGRAADTTQTYMAARLFVGNLPFTTTENDLQDHFAQAGAVLAINIMQDRATGRSRGFAFVEMASPDDATKAISMFHQKDFQGRPLTVNEARPRDNGVPAVAAAAVVVAAVATVTATNRVDEPRRGVSSF